MQSNHTRQVAAVAAKIGMKCRLVQEAWVPHEDAVYDRVGNIQLSRIMGADVRLVDDGFDIGIRKSWEEALKDVEAKGGRPYAIPAGASVHKYGGLGYVGFAEEVRAQERELGFAFDYVVVCTVTGSTHAGMVVGFAKDGRQRKVIGIDASARRRKPRPRSSTSRARPRLVELGQEIADDDVVLIEDYAYPVYGVPSNETKEAIRLSARLEGMITDPVYEGKSMQGMIDLVSKGFFPKGSKVLLRPSRRRAGPQRLRLRVPKRMTMTGSAPRAVLGIDAAWTATQPSGVACAVETEGGWRLAAVGTSYGEFIDLANGAPRSKARPSGCKPNAAAILEAASKIFGVRKDLDQGGASISSRSICRCRDIG